MKFVAVILSFLFLASTNAQAQTWRDSDRAMYPECAYFSSDIDGDWFGFENGETCIVTENSISGSINITTDECVDDNADGWGWNGESSCIAEIPVSACVDTDPVGDGWGWDGSASCRVVPESRAMEEVRIIESKMIDVYDRENYPSKYAAFECPAWYSNAADIYRLHYDGRLRTETGAYGLWSTGIATSDGKLLISRTYGNRSYTRRDTVFITEDKVIIGYNGANQDCEWL